MKLRWTLTCLLALFVESAEAGGPTYSRYGIGDLRFFGSNRAAGMGLLGLSLSGDGFINRFNPAGLSRISLTRISGGFAFSSSTIKDQSGSTKLARGDFESLALAFPVSKDHGIAFFVDTSPLSDVRYKVQTRQQTPGSPSSQTFTGVGGLSTLSLGTSYSPRPDVSLGIKYTYVYGTIENITNVEFDDVTFLNSEIHTSLFHSGSIFTLGAVVEDVGSFFGAPSLAQMQAGIVLSVPARLSVKEEKVLLTSSLADTAFVRRGITNLPFGFGLGVSYLAEERMRISAEAYGQQWRGADFFGGLPGATRNSLRLGAGIEFLPHRLPTTYGDRIAYRAGFTYNATYHEVNGQAVNEWFVSGGTSLPIGPDARANLNLQLGSRGTMAGGLQKDTFIRVSLSLSASETWFLTLEED